MTVTVNAAVYGVGVYGVARYGKVIVSGLDQVEATGQTSGVQVNVSELLASVAGTASVSAVGIGNSVTLSGVVGTGQVNTVEDKPTELLNSVQATGQVSAVQPNTTAGITGVEAITGSIEPVSAGGFEIDITERITAGVEATGQSGTVQPNTAAGLTGVEATGSLPFVQPIVSPTKELVGVSGSLVFNPAQPNVTEPVGGLSATGSTGSLTLHTTAGITSAGMTLTLNKPDQTAVVFDFESVKETYSRKRTVYLSRVA